MVGVRQPCCAADDVNSEMHLTDTLNRDEIAQLIRVSRDTLRKRYEPRPDYPRPVVRLSRKTVLWARSDIVRWIERQR